MYGYDADILMPLVTFLYERAENVKVYRVSMITRLRPAPL